MADLYPPAYAPSRQNSYSRHPQDHPSYPQQSHPLPTAYGAPQPQPVLGTSSGNSSDDSQEHHSKSPDLHQPQSQQQQQSASQQQSQMQLQSQAGGPIKNETKPQATFLTKLYALLERPENHHMIRWDPAGEHIIVERPEQLALHVLPSIYRQSRFASFSRQLNIYGFMRKVNLRNVDPAIDDPDASTWSHPTLNRHSPPEVVANFKRRVPPRLPTPRKREVQESPTIPQQPRSAVSMNQPPLPGPNRHAIPSGGRSRGFSAPGQYPPPHAGNWNGANYQRSPLPPLNVPSDSHAHHTSMYAHPGHNFPPSTPTDDSPTSPATPYHMPYAAREMSTYAPYGTPGEQQGSWPYTSAAQTGSSHPGGSNLSSLLNPSGGYGGAGAGAGGRPQPTINTSYGYGSSLPVPGEHSASSLSPDSRPTTGYSVSSVPSTAYDDGGHHDYGRPSSSHHARPGSPDSRPGSKAGPPSASGGYPQGSSLSIRRARRHSQAMSPYPSPYDQQPPQQHHGAEPPRPSSSSSPGPMEDHTLSRSRSMIQLPSVDHHPFQVSAGHADFAYALPAVGSVTPIENVGGGAGGLMPGGWNGGRSSRPSTATSTISVMSQTSSSHAHTPPIPEHYGGMPGEAHISRHSPVFGYMVPRMEHMTQAYDGKNEH